MGFLKNIFIVSVLFNLVLFFAPGIPPYDIEFKPLKFENVPFEDALSVNNKLDNFEKLSTVAEGISFNKFIGPESFAYKDNYLYTGIAGGDIVRIRLDQLSEPWEHVFKFGKKCSEMHEEMNCGRPLGIRFDNQGRLVVADAVYGIYRVDTKTRKADILVSPTVKTDGKFPKLANSVAIAKDDSIYYTIASTKNYLHEGLIELLMASTPSGRVLKYDPKTNSSQVLIEDLCFANGIALSKNDEFFVVSDLGRQRLLQYFLKGPKKGTWEVFANPPGLVDNIVSTLDGNFLAAVVSPMNPGRKLNLLFDFILKYPYLNRYVLRLAYNFKSLVEFADEMIGIPGTDKFLYYMNNLSVHGDKSYALVVEYNSKGELVKSWHSPEGKIYSISEANLIKGYLYLGSPWNNFAARVKYT